MATSTQGPDSFLVWGIAVVIGFLLLMALPKFVLILALIGFVLGYANMEAPR